MDLGTKRESLNGPTSPSPTDSPKVSYPSFAIRDAKATEFLAANECELGDEHEATVKLRVTGVRADQYGKSVDFDVLSIDVTGGGEDEDEDDAEEKMLGYKRGASKKEAPDTSAKTLYE